MPNIFRKAAKAVSDAAQGVSTTASGAANSATDTATAVARAADATGHAIVKDTADAAARAARKAADAMTIAATAARDAADLVARGAGGAVSRAVKDGAVEAAKMAKNAADDARTAADQARRTAGDVSTLNITVRLPGRVGGAAFSRAERAAREAADDAERAARAAAELAEEAAELAEELGQQLSEVPAVLTAAIGEAIKNSPVYQWLLTNAAALYMDPPKTITCTGNLTPGQYAGKEPVYYVNGMLTSDGAAKSEGDALATHLTRLVYLIHNPTFLESPYWTGTWNIWDDPSEAVYDKFWPETLGAGVKLWPVPTPLGVPGSTAGLPFTQLNTTTRQITHLLYHANGPIAVVSHSQGCLQMRNASLITALFRGQDWIGENLMWVATGLPLSDVEIWPWPKKFKGLVEHGDFVAQIIGLQGGPGMVDAMSGASHSFINQYVEKVQADWLLP